MKKNFYTAALLLAALMLAPLVVRAETITRLTLSGPPGEYISQGQTMVFIPNDGTFAVSHDSNNGVTMQFSTPSRPWLWTVQFGGPNASSPQVGIYSDCWRYGFNNSHPGLAIWGDGRGCNEVTGTFEVKQIVYSEYDVASVWVTFTQYCDNQSNPLIGELIYNVEASTPTRSATWGSLKSIYR